MIDIEQLADAVAERVAERLAQRAARKFVSIKEYSQANALSERTIHRAIAEERLATERVGRRVLIPADAKISPR
jgi:hypothetical protein